MNRVSYFEIVRVLDGELNGQLDFDVVENGDVEGENLSAFDRVWQNEVSKEILADQQVGTVRNYCSLRRTGMNKAERIAKQVPYDIIIALLIFKAKQKNYTLGDSSERNFTSTT